VRVLDPEEVIEAVTPHVQYAAIPETGALTELLEALIDLRLHYAEEICIPVEHCTGEYFRKSNEAIAKATDAPQQTSDASAPPADRSEDKNAKTAR
jgi:hypothetical protein